MNFALLDPLQNYNNVGSCSVPSATLENLSDVADAFGKDVSDCELEFRDEIGYIVLHREGLHVLVFARIS